jgi:zinc transporter ZupT
MFRTSLPHPFPRKSDKSYKSGHELGILYGMPYFQTHPNTAISSRGDWALSIGDRMDGGAGALLGQNLHSIVPRMEQMKQMKQMKQKMKMMRLMMVMMMMMVMMVKRETGDLRR